MGPNNINSNNDNINNNIYNDKTRAPTSTNLSHDVLFEAKEIFNFNLSPKKKKSMVIVRLFMKFLKCVVFRAGV